MKRLLGSPKFHYWAAGFFAVQVPIAQVTALKDSTPYLVFLSLWALVTGHWSTGEAAEAKDAADDATTIARRVLEVLETEGYVVREADE